MVSCLSGSCLGTLAERNTFACFYMERLQAPSCLFSRDELEFKVSLKILAWNGRWKHWMQSLGTSRSHSKTKASSCPTHSKRILLYCRLKLKHSILGNTWVEWCFCFHAEWDGEQGNKNSVKLRGPTTLNRHCFEYTIGIWKMQIRNWAIQGTVVGSPNPWTAFQITSLLAVAVWAWLLLCCRNQDCHPWSAAEQVPGVGARPLHSPIHLLQGSKLHGLEHLVPAQSNLWNSRGKVCVPLSLHSLN